MSSYENALSVFSSFSGTIMIVSIYMVVAVPFAPGLHPFLSGDICRIETGTFEHDRYGGEDALGISSTPVADGLCVVLKRLLNLKAARAKTTFIFVSRQDSLPP